MPWELLWSEQPAGDKSCPLTADHSPRVFTWGDLQENELGAWTSQNSVQKALSQSCRAGIRQFWPRLWASEVWAEVNNASSTQRVTLRENYRRIYKETHTGRECSDCRSAAPESKNPKISSRQTWLMRSEASEARPGEALRTRVTGRDGAVVSRSRLGQLVLAASPSALPRGQNKSTADANSQAQKLEGKNHHPVTDCLLMESINLWPKKSQLMCGERCSEKINNLDWATHARSLHTGVMPSFWGNFSISTENRVVLSIHHFQQQQSELKFVLFNLDQRHKAYQNLQCFRNTVTFSTVWGVRGENFQGDCYWGLK